MHFRDLAPSAVNVTCLKNWITSKNHSGVNIRPSWPRSDSRAAVGDVKAPPATLGTLWEPFEETVLITAPTLACKLIISSPNPWIKDVRPPVVFLYPSPPLLFSCINTCRICITFTPGFITSYQSIISLYMWNYLHFYLSIYISLYNLSMYLYIFVLSIYFLTSY